MFQLRSEDCCSLLEELRGNVVKELGYGGHINACHFMDLLSPLDGADFAQAVLASEQIVYDFDVEYWDRPELLLFMIAQKDFSNEIGFDEIQEMFELVFGVGVAI